MTISDTQSVNGTWVSRIPHLLRPWLPHKAPIKVNKRRLADGEARVLHNGDRVAFTPLPFDLRLNAKRDGMEYADARSQTGHALVFVYHKYAMDTFQANLSDAGNAARRSFSELNRIRKVLQRVRSSRCVSWREGKLPSLINAL